jgi:hypothetical protein
VVNWLPLYDDSFSWDPTKYIKLDHSERLSGTHSQVSRRKVVRAIMSHHLIVSLKEDLTNTSGRLPLPYVPPELRVNV